MLKGHRQCNQLKLKICITATKVFWGIDFEKECQKVTLVKGEANFLGFVILEGYVGQTGKD